MASLHGVVPLTCKRQEAGWSTRGTIRDPETSAAICLCSHLSSDVTPVLLSGWHDGVARMGARLFEGGETPCAANHPRGCSVLGSV